MAYENVYSGRRFETSHTSTLKTVLAVGAVAAGIFVIARGYIQWKMLETVGKGVRRLARRDFTLSKNRFPFLYYGRENARPLHFRLLGRKSLGWHALLP